MDHRHCRRSWYYCRARALRADDRRRSKQMHEARTVRLVLGRNYETNHPGTSYAFDSWSNALSKKNQGVANTPFVH